MAEITKTNDVSLNIVELFSAKIQRPIDEITEDVKALAILKSAVPSLGHILGIPEANRTEAFEKDGVEQTLFLNYCMYEYYNMLSDFQTNYANELAQCKQKWLVQSYLGENSEQN